MTIDPIRLDAPEGHKLGRDGRWRDAGGKFVEHPPLDSTFADQTRAIRTWASGGGYDDYELRRELAWWAGVYAPAEPEKEGRRFGPLFLVIIALVPLVTILVAGYAVAG